MSMIEIKYASGAGGSLDVKDYDYFETYKYQIEVDEEDKDKLRDVIKNINNAHSGHCLEGYIEKESEVFCCILAESQELLYVSSIEKKYDPQITINGLLEIYKGASKVSVIADDIIWEFKNLRVDHSFAYAEKHIIKQAGQIIAESRESERVKLAFPYWDVSNTSEWPETWTGDNAYEFENINTPFPVLFFGNYITSHKICYHMNFSGSSFHYGKKLILLLKGMVEITPEDNSHMVSYSGFFCPKFIKGVPSVFQQFGLTPWMVSAISNYGADKGICWKDFYMYSLEGIIGRNEYRRIFYPAQILQNDAINKIEKILNDVGLGLDKSYLSEHINGSSDSQAGVETFSYEQSKEIIRLLAPLDYVKTPSDYEKPYEDTKIKRSDYEPDVCKKRMYQSFEEIEKTEDPEEKKSRMIETLKNNGSIRSQYTGYFNTCVHESGHALIMEHFFGSDIIAEAELPVTVGNNYAGVVVPKWSPDLDYEDIYNYAKVFLGGKAAEEVFYGDSTFGAIDDIFCAANTMLMILGRYAEFVSDGEKIFCRISDMENGTIIKFPADDALPRLMMKCLEDTRGFLSDKRELIKETACSLLAQKKISGEIIRNEVETFRNKKELEKDDELCRDVKGGIYAISYSLEQMRQDGGLLSQELEESDFLKMFEKPGDRFMLADRSDYSACEAAMLLKEIVGKDVFDKELGVIIEVNDKGDNFEVYVDNTEGVYKN